MARLVRAPELMFIEGQRFAERSMFPEDIEALARQVLVLAQERSLTLTTVESCTGGLVIAALTAIPGSSLVVDRAFVTYSNVAKSAMVGVTGMTIATHGAVSERVAVAMAEGGRKAANAGAAVAITGIAGPGGGSPDKPVGLVHFAFARSGHPTKHGEERFGDIGRQAVRLESVRTALRMMAEGLA